MLTLQFHWYAMILHILQYAITFVLLCGDIISIILLYVLKQNSADGVCDDKRLS